MLLEKKEVPTKCDVSDGFVTLANRVAGDLDRLFCN